MVQKLLIFVEGSKLLGLRTVFTLCTLSTNTRTLQMDAQHNSVKK